MGEARCDVQRIRKTVAQQKYSWRKLKVPPTAVCSLPSRLKWQYQLGWSDFLDENIFFVRRSWQGSFWIWFISDTPDYNFVTKVDFSSRGLSDGSAGRYLIARHSHSPDENRPCFRSGSQTGGCSDLAHWVCSAVPSVENFSLHLYALHPNLSVLWVKILLRSAGACPCLLREYVRWHIYMTTHFSHITVQYACPFSMPNLPFLLIWLLSYRKWLRPPFLSIWQSSIGFVLDFLLDYLGTRSYWYDRRPLSNWYDYDRNFLIEITELSYRNDQDFVFIWGEGKEIFTLCYLSIRQSFFLSLIQKVWRSFTSNVSHLHRWNDRSFWAPKILSMGQ